ncbi:phospholipase D-like domain-containing protein [Clostridium culturomicium]|uniref:phospholipase D-like domain-containing protein n=1 Tax=Clostridium culturomicium TaxID=1499683 RepID=UPI00385773D4
MKLFNWLKSKFTSDKDRLIEELRREIEQLKQENRDVREKIIEFPHNNLQEEVKVEFYESDIEERIIENISMAKEELCIAMAWFTSGNIIDAITKLRRKGVSVNVIIDDNKYNKDENNIYKLISACNELSIAAVFSSRNGKQKTMHNKYCIIDNQKVIDGSYNWSNNAKNNEEHIVIIHSTNVAKMFKGNFDRLYKKYSSKNQVKEIG